MPLKAVEEQKAPCGLVGDTIRPKEQREPEATPNPPWGLGLWTQG